jgi:hypothetical protein
LEVLEAIVDGLHDLNNFKEFLNQRMEEKSAYNKQKMDIYAEIKVIDGQRQEFIKEHQAQNPPLAAVPNDPQPLIPGGQNQALQSPEDPL